MATRGGSNRGGSNKTWKRLSSRFPAGLRHAGMAHQPGDTCDCVLCSQSRQVKPVVWIWTGGEHGNPKESPEAGTED